MYDDLDNLSEVWYTVDGTRTKAYEYSYTKSGQIHSLEDFTSGTVTVYRYDASGRLVGYGEYSSEDYKNNVTRKITYNENSEIWMVVTHITRNIGGEVSYDSLQDTYSYDSEGKITSHRVTGNSPVNQSYSYDAFDRLASVTNSAYGGFYNKTEYTYKQYETEGEATQSATRVDTYKSTVGTGSGSTSTTYSYTYDGNGYIVNINAGTSSVSYEYSPSGMLIRENNYALGKTYVYTYDNAGNITEKTIFNYSTDEVLDEMPLRVISYSYGDSIWGDLLISYDGLHDMIYDEIGNPIAYDNGVSYEFAWEGRRLVSANKNGTLFTFTYNNDGIRTSKSVNGIDYKYSLYGSTILSEQWENHVIIYIYDANGTPLGYQYYNTLDGTTEWENFWFEKNIQGDVVAVYSDAGTKLVSYTYDAWGNHTTTYHNGGATTAAQYNPYRYRGYYYDTDLGLYYLNSRYYDAAVGRFINPDNSLYHNMLGYNMFVYCNNNPVNYYDFTGESAIAIGGLVLVFFGTILGLTSSEKQEATPEQIKNAQDAADKAELNPGTDEKGNYTVDIRIDTQETVDMVDEIAYDYFYERLYERTVEKALGDNQSIDALMDINHMRWEFSIHIFGNELNIENCKDTDLNVEETLWSMFKRFLEQ